MALVFVGVAVLGGIFLDLSSTARDESGVTVIGVIDSVDPNARYKYDRTKYHYTVDGHTYHGSTSDTDTSRVGHKLELRYDPDDPSTSWRPHREPAPSGQMGPSKLTVVIVFGVLAVLVWFMARPPWRRRYRQERDAARRAAP